jgi:hypothetical protein
MRAIEECCWPTLHFQKTRIGHIVLDYDRD